MPNNQIQKGYDFNTGQLVTADNLDALAQEATLKKGAISEQPAQTDAVQGSDELIINDVSDTVATTPKKATVSQIMTAGVDAIIEDLSVSSITGQTKLPVLNPDSAGVVASGYTYANDNLVTVTSIAHGLSQGDYIDIVCENTSGDVGEKFSGRFVVQSIVSVDTFVYKNYAPSVASSGTCTWKKSGITSLSGSESVTKDILVGGDAYVFGKIKTFSNSSMLMPKGTTAERPLYPESGEMRYNTETGKIEFFDGSAWKISGGASFFNNAVGGDYVLEPSADIYNIQITTTNYTSPTIGTKLVCTQATQHNLNIGQYVKINVPFYQMFNGEYVVVDKTDFSFTINLPSNESSFPSLNNTPATYNKSGNHKVHVFNNSGTFTTGDADGFIEILLVGGGGACNQSHAAGGGGGFLYKRQHFVNKNTTYSVIVGYGGIDGQNNGDGGTSSFVNANSINPNYENLYAYGGKGGIGNNLGGSNGGTSTGEKVYVSRSSAGSGASGAGSYMPNVTTTASPSLWGTGKSSCITNVDKHYSIGGYNWFAYNYPITGNNLQPAYVHECLPDEIKYSPSPNTGRGGSATWNGNSPYITSTDGSSGFCAIRYTFLLE